MLYLTRKIGESIVINDDIEVTVIEIRGKSVKLGLTFPAEATVYRREVFDRIQAERAEGERAPGEDCAVPQGNGHATAKTPQGNGRSAAGLAVPQDVRPRLVADKAKNGG